MSRADRGADKPRAMIHRRILDVAESSPDASLTAIAEAVSGASPDLVERVLDEYGDPGRDTDAETQDDEPMNAANASTPETESASDDESTADPDESSADEPPAAADLSEKQRRTLGALYERPDASQADLADELDVTRATVSRRLNAIPGFEWSDRRAFAEAVFGSAADVEADPSAADTPAAHGDGGDTAADAPADDPVDDDRADGDRPNPEGGDTGHPDAGDRSGIDPAAVDAVEGALSDLAERVAAIESRVAASDGADASGPADGADQTEGTHGNGETEGSDGPEECDAGLSPELAHKVVHACMESDRLSEEEELAVLRTFMER